MSPLLSTLLILAGFVLLFAFGVYLYRRDNFIFRVVGLLIVSPLLSGFTLIFLGAFVGAIPFLGTVTGQTGFNLSFMQFNDDLGGALLRGLVLGGLPFGFFVGLILLSLALGQDRISTFSTGDTLWILTSRDEGATQGKLGCLSITPLLLIMVPFGIILSLARFAAEHGFTMGMAVDSAAVMIYHIANITLLLVLGLIFARD